MEQPCNLGTSLSVSFYISPSLSLSPFPLSLSLSLSVHLCFSRPPSLSLSYTPSFSMPHPTQSVIRQDTGRIYGVKLVSGLTPCLLATDVHGIVHVYDRSDYAKLDMVQAHNSWIRAVEVVGNTVYSGGDVGDVSICISKFKKALISRDLRLRPLSRLDMTPSHFHINADKATLSSSIIAKKTVIENRVLPSALSRNPGKFLSFAVVQTSSTDPTPLYLVAASFNGSIVVWNMSLEKKEFKFCYIRAHRRPVYSVCVVDHDRNIIASGSEDSTVKLFELKDVFEKVEKLREQQTDEEKKLVASLNGESFLIGTLGVNNNKESARGHTGHVTALSVCGPYLTSASFDRTIRVWAIQGFLEGSSEAIPCIRVLTGHLDGIWCLKYVPSLEVLASGSSDTTIRLWNTRDGDFSCVKVISGNKSDVYSLDVEHATVEKTAKSGTYNVQYGRITLVSGCADGVIRLWEYHTKSVDYEA